MRTRGKVYWEWAQPGIHFRNYDERAESGLLINIQVRTSKDGITQLFFGIYGEVGRMLNEEHYPDRRGQTPTSAMAWALQRAHDWIDSNDQGFRILDTQSPKPRSKRVSPSGVL